MIAQARRTESVRLSLGGLSRAPRSLCHCRDDRAARPDAVRGFRVLYGPDDRSALRRRLETAFDRFVDLQPSEIRGRTTNQRRGPCADRYSPDTRGRRPRTLVRAPRAIQVSFSLSRHDGRGVHRLRHSGLVHCSGLATTLLLGESCQLTGGWWPAEIPWEIAEGASTRSAYGLPDDAFVFCCFNASYKITPPMFSVWMRLLQAKPRSVLWLGFTDSVTQDNLRREAAQRGIGPERLLFAPREPMAGYLARHRHAGRSVPRHTSLQCSRDRVSRAPRRFASADLRRRDIRRPDRGNDAARSRVARSRHLLDRRVRTSGQPTGA